MIRIHRIAHRLVRGRHSSLGKVKSLEELIFLLRKENPGLTLNAYEASHKIEIQDIKVEEKGQGTGTKVIRQLQEYARRVGKPIVLHPEPERGKTGDLMRFYKGLGFVKNKGRKTDFTISSLFGLTMYWKP
jgi:hypothetical protein